MAKSANHLLDEFAARAYKAQQGMKIAAPWTDARLDDESQAAAVALIHHGIIGASEAGGGKVKLWLGRNRVGNPFFRLYSGWVFYIAMLTWMFATIWLGRRHDGLGDVTGLVLSAAALAYFGVHAHAHWRFAQLWLHLGRLGEQTKLGACVMGAVLAAGALYEFIGRVF